jgi:uncharacterized protein (DUF58 family)
MTIALQHQSEHLATLLPPLLLEAERVASAVQQGIHGRRRAGSGESFWQFRRYTPGDAAARIDWRQSARTDKLFIREREWEAAQSVYLWADNSGSMRYSSAKNLPTKSERAQVLMLALASLLLRGGEQVIWLAREPIAARGKSGLERIAAQMEVESTQSQQRSPPLEGGVRGGVVSTSTKDTASGENPPPDLPLPPTPRGFGGPVPGPGVALAEPGKGGGTRLRDRSVNASGSPSGNNESTPPDIRLAKHAHMILCSDFLMPPEELEKLMRRYAALNLRGALMHILDPAEEDLPFEGRLELKGCEQESPLVLPNARALREDYRQRMDEHKARLMRYAESAGWFYLPHVTSAPPHRELLNLYQYLSADPRGL